MPSTKTNGQRSKQMGGFDEKVTDKLVEAEKFIKTDIEFIGITLRVKYLERTGGNVKSATTKTFSRRRRKRLHKKYTVREFQIDPFLALEPETRDEQVFVSVSEEDLLQFFEQEDIKSDPERSKDTVHIKLSEETCEIQSLGERTLRDEPDYYMGYQFYKESSEGDFKTKWNRYCGDAFKRRFREVWAKQNDCYEGEWIIKNVNDYDEEETAILSLRRKGQPENTTQFTVKAPDEWEDGDPTKEFVDSVGNGLIANAEMESVYVSFEDLDHADPVETNDLGLKLYCIEDKPTFFTKIKNNLPTL